MGGSQPVQSPPNNGGFGGDLLGFGLSSPQPVVSQPPANNLLGGADLMGFGFGSPSSNPPPQSQPQGGFNFGVTPPQQAFTPPPQPQPPANNNFGFSLLGNSPPAQQPVQPPQPTSTQSSIGFQPIVNNNPNKILAYDNAHLQIWIDCIK